jgi:hypothetical protein
MRLFVTRSLCLLAVALAAWGAEPVALRRAREETARIRKLVDAGALPRIKLEEAERRLAEAQDEDILERTLYGAVGVEELTEEQSEAMLAAARRQVERQRLRVEETKRLVEQGALPRTSLTPVLQEYDRSKKTVDLAESRARLFRELMDMVRVELEAELAAHDQPSEEPLRQAVEHYNGLGAFTNAQLHQVMAAFEREFGKPLPVSALGDTAFHRSLGFDHRGRVDVALHPDDKEGVWLRRYLEAAKIPYFAFRKPVPGSATGAHIHIGPPSTRLRAAD